MHSKEFSRLICKQGEYFGPDIFRLIFDALSAREHIIENLPDELLHVNLLQRKGFLAALQKAPEIIDRDRRILVALYEDYQLLKPNASYIVIPQPEDLSLVVGIDKRSLYFYVPSIACSVHASQDLPLLRPVVLHDSGSEVERYFESMATPEDLYRYEHIDPVGYKPWCPRVP